MPRATKVLPGAEALRGQTVDTLLLNYDQRLIQHGFFFTGKGACVEIDLPEPGCLRTDDVLALDDGGLVEIVADAEPVTEIRLADPAALARLAWMLGDRHVPVQIFANRLRVRANPDIAALIAPFGAKTTAITAPFEPDGGHAAAHDHAHHHHDHHDHAHCTHGHHHHDHAHDHAQCGHAHKHGS